MRYLVIVTVLWAFSFSLIGQYLAGKVDPDLAVLVRVLIAAAVFLPMTVWRGLPSRMVAGFWLAGALQFGITYVCLYRSFTVLTVPEVLLFTVLTPIYVTLIDDALIGRFNRWAMFAALVAVTGGIIIRFKPLAGDYLLGFILLQIANATFAAGQVLCRRLLLRYEPAQPLYRFFGHFFLGALLIAVIALVFLIILAALVIADRIDRYLGQTGRAILTRLLGVILAALAVQFVADGVKALMAV